MKDSLKTLVFATILGVVCAGLLAAANKILKPYQEANAAAEKLKTVYDVLGVSYSQDANSHDLLKLMRSKDFPEAPVVEHSVPTAQDGNMVVFTYDHPDAGELYAIEFAGPGLWGPIDGLICLKSDLKTVYNISFYKQEETPGLGGEIGTPAFTDEFKDKSIDGTGEPGIAVVKPGAASGDKQVDGISGATLTCDKVTEMINEISKKILDNREAILKVTAGAGEGLKEAGNE